MTNFFRELLYALKSVFFKPVEASHKETPSEVEQAEGIRPRLGIVVGHEAKAPGATMAITKESEYSYNSKIAELIIAHSGAFPVDVRIFKRDGIGIAGAYKKANEALCDYVVELHFNAVNTKVAGTETLSSTDRQDIDFARVVQAELCKVFGRQGMSRGVKPLPRSARGGFSLYAYPQGRNCLVEPFFGDNPMEAEMAYSLMDDYAKGLLRAVDTFHKARQSMGLT